MQNNFKQIKDFDYLLDISRGKNTSNSLVWKFGYANIDTTEQVIEPMTVPNYYPHYLDLTAPHTIRIKQGGNFQDSPTGPGAWGITVEGLSGNYDRISENITTSGTGASQATRQEFLRVNRAYVTTAGTGYFNSSNIVVETHTGATEMIIIPASQGQTQSMKYTIPRGYDGAMTDFTTYIEKDKPATVNFRIRGPEPSASIRVLSKYIGQDNEHLNSFTIPVYIPEKSDIWLSAVVAVNASDIATNGEIVLVKK